MSNESKYKTVPKVWTIQHPETGGPLDVVALSVYESQQRELEQAQERIGTIADVELAMTKDELATERERSAKLVEALEAVINSPEQASDAYGAFKISIRAARQAIASYSKGGAE